MNLERFLVKVHLKKPEVSVTGIFLERTVDKETGAIDIVLGTDADAKYPWYVISYDSIAFIERVIPEAAKQDNPIIAQNLPPQTPAATQNSPGNQQYEAVPVSTRNIKEITEQRRSQGKIPVIENLPDYTPEEDISQKVKDLKQVAEKERQTLTNEIEEKVNSDPLTAHMQYNYSSGAEALFAANKKMAEDISKDEKPKKKRGRKKKGSLPKPKMLNPKSKQITMKKESDE